MPVYEYECGMCHHVFDRRQRFDEEPVAICPRCQGRARRVIHSVPIIFRGSGFYSTDHGRGYQCAPSRDKHKPAEAKPQANGDKNKTRPESKET